MNNKKFATLQTLFKWSELSDDDKNQILKQFGFQIHLTKWCHQDSPALFQKGKKDKWTIKNILDLYL